MPKLGCNGYSVFAEQMRPALEEKLGRKFNRFNDLIHAAGPYWESLSEDEKRNWKERAKDYKRGDEFQCRKKCVRLRNFERRQHRQQLGSGDEVEDVVEETTEIDEEDSDFHDPMELPGPVSQRSSHSPVPVPVPVSVPRGSPGKKGKERAPIKSFNAFDFVCGKPNEILALIDSMKLDENFGAKHTFVKVPPRFRHENGSGDQEYIPIAYFNESQKLFMDLEQKSLSYSHRFKGTVQNSRNHKVL